MFCQNIFEDNVYFIFTFLFQSITCMVCYFSHSEISCDSIFLRIRENLKILSHREINSILKSKQRISSLYVGF